jgi:hypothetical protein
LLVHDIFFFPSTEHLPTALETLETAQSVFLLKAAENFAAATIASNLNNIKADEFLSPQLSGNGTAENVSSSINAASIDSVVQASVEMCVATVEEMSKCQASVLDSLVASTRASTYHQSVLNLTLSLSSCERFCQWKAQERPFLMTLLQLVFHHPSDMTASTALNCVINIAAFM